MKRAGKFWVPDEEQIQLAALAAGGWQISHLDAALAHVKKFRVAVDGGAHVGSWTLHMAEFFRHVIAFEPNEQTFACLGKNITEGSWDDGHLPVIEIHPLGLGEGPGKMSMGEDGKYSNGGNTGGRFLKPNEPGDVKVIALDSFDLSVCDFLKLDVEGFELYALRGARETLLRCHPVVQIEVKHRMAARYGLAEEAAGKFLETLGMQKLGRAGSDEIFGW